LSFRDFTTVRAYIVLGEPDKAYELIGKLKRFAENFHRPLDLCEAGVLESALLWAEGRRDEATKALTHALEAIRPYGFVRTVADEGAAILPVLKRLAAAMRQNGYDGPLSQQTIGEMMLSAHGTAKSHKGITANLGKPKNHAVKLSGRQLQMLTLLSQGYGNTQIAGITGLAIPTVKTHLFYAYQKLSVNNAMDAVLRARELGLIEH
jgi:LuxR family maltose regulon positive regulatory protein